MPLTFKPAEYAYHSPNEEIRFNATAPDGSMVVCAVGRETLADFEQMAPNADTPEALVTSFLARRAWIEQAASHRYDRGWPRGHGLLHVRLVDLDRASLYWTEDPR